MGINYENLTRTHWNYFLAIEQDFLVVTRYVEPCEENNSTFSIELARIIMAATQEADVLLKRFCESIDSDYSGGGIHAYHESISSHVPSLFTEIVAVERFSMNSQPYSSWTHDTPPLWWTANNKIKHHRDFEFSKATLKNAFNSVAGLLVITVHFYKDMISKKNNTEVSFVEATNFLIPETRLFKLRDDYYTHQVRAYPPEW